MLTMYNQHAVIYGVRRARSVAKVLRAEVGNVAWKRAWKGEISPEHARAVAHALPQLLSVTMPSRDLLDAALELALKREHPVCDCMYVAPAESRKAPLVTADTRLLERLWGARWRGDRGPAGRRSGVSECRRRHGQPSRSHDQFVTRRLEVACISCRK